jgi:hypothetical protein
MENATISRRPHLAFDATAPNEIVIALHCSGADRNQWRKLSEALGCDIQVIAPSFILRRYRGMDGPAGVFAQGRNEAYP